MAIKAPNLQQASLGRLSLGTEVRLGIRGLLANQGLGNI
jgi:hypothetical protein